MYHRIASYFIRPFDPVGNLSLSVHRLSLFITQHHSSLFISYSFIPAHMCVINSFGYVCCVHVHRHTCDSVIPSIRRLHPPISSSSSSLLSFIYYCCAAFQHFGNILAVGQYCLVSGDYDFSAFALYLEPFITLPSP
jgi:hypothetical protein